MEALVMGGTEFISSSVAKYLISKGYIVDIFTRGIRTVKYDGIRNHLKGNRNSIEELELNLSDKSYDYVFDISAYAKEDVEKLIGVLDKEQLKRYVYCSSGSVYKPTSEVVTEEFSRGENQNWGDYGLNKKLAEDYLMDLYENSNFPVTIFRPTYIYGEGNNLYREAHFFDRVSQGLDIPIPDGDAKNQFVHIEDVVRVFESAVYAEKSIGQAYNLTHPRFVTWEYLTETCMDVINKKVNTKRIDSKLNFNVREYFPFRNVTYLLDINKLERDGLYVPRIDLFEGLKRTYEWYINEKPNVSDSKMNKIDFVLAH